MNELTQKNAELGRFLFCERYTLQPVKNSLFIAEGQDLKRGAIVDVNGVLVGTNSLMPYAVLENDCDTRAKGAFASVFVKGEFNFDKLFFADGLSTEDLDNIVYNGSGIGLVIKPYNFSSGFAPKSDNKELSYIKQILTNPLNLPPKTIRCKFASDYTPTMGTSQTLVDSDNNVWDIVFDSAVALFESSSLIEVLGANTSGVTDMSSMFVYCENLEKVALFDTSSVTNMAGMFLYCNSLASVPLFDTSSVTNMGPDEIYGFVGMFGGCHSLKSVPRFDTSSVTNMAAMFASCTSLTSVPLFDTSSVVSMSAMFNHCTKVVGGALALYKQASAQATPPTSHNNAFSDCGSDTITGVAELAQIPSSWGGTAAG